MKDCEKKITLLAFSLTGVVLIAIGLFSFLYARYQYIEHRESAFDAVVAGVGRWGRDDTLSMDDISELGRKEGVWVYLEDSGHPLRLSAALGGDETVTARAVETAKLNHGVDLSQTPIAGFGDTLAEFYLSISGQRYRCYVGVLPADVGWHSLVAVQDTASETQHVAGIAALFLLIIAAGLGCIVLFSWLISGRAILPAREAVRRQRSFIAGAGHELKTPLSVVATAAELLERGRADVPKVAGTIKGEALLMGRLVDDLLFLTEVGETRWQLRKSSVEIDTLLLDVAEAQDAYLNERHISIETELPREAVRPMWCDGERIRQVRVSLLNNAIRFSPEGAPIRLVLRQDENTTAVHIVDHGPGIPDAAREKIFEPFYQADESRSDRRHFGLGLAITREIMQAHGGTIQMRDTDGGGATFIVTLPDGQEHR